MSKPFNPVCLYVAMLSLIVSFQALFAMGPATVSYNNSIKPLRAWTQSGPPDPHHPWMTRSTLTPQETGATMDFEVALKMRNFAELQARVGRGDRVSRQEMEAKYDPSPSDVKAVTDWLSSQGFTLTRHDANPLALFVRGTIDQIQKAMGVTFAKVSFEGKTYTSARTAPSLPASLSGAVLGINGLQPHIQPHTHVMVKPNNLTGTNPPFLPSQIAQADNATGLYSSGITGTGQTIAIVIDIFPSQGDLSSFWQTYGVNQSLNNFSFIQVVPVGSGAQPSTLEATLDAEWSSSMAPGAQVRVYATSDLDFTDLDQGYQSVYNDVIAHPEYGLHQMSLSFGIGETYVASSQVRTDDQFFAQLVSAGVTIFASSGDGASTPGTGPNNPDVSGPLQVESPACDPNITGVGGTSLALNPDGSVSSETAWSDSGGGLSNFFSRPYWQRGNGLPAGTMRAVPDVACPADPNTGAVLYWGGPTSVGGTSWSSPTWAGYCALLNQARAKVSLTPLGLLGPRIYPLLGTANFRDITSGSNSSGASSGGNYTAGVGYDPITGIGVPLMQALTQTLTTPSLLVQNQPALANVLPGQNAALTASTSGSPITYQWQRMPVGTTTWSNLINNGTYSGVTTASLIISNTTTSMSGDQFQCVVNNNSNVLNGAPSVLIVSTPLTVITVAGQAGNIGNLQTNPNTLNFDYPSGFALDNPYQVGGIPTNLYVADYNNNVIREVTSAGTVSIPYGSTHGHSGSNSGFSGNNARLLTPNDVASDATSTQAAQNLYVADTGNNRICKIMLSTKVVSTFATGFNSPNGVAVDSSGNVYVADTSNDVIDKITPGGTVGLLAGQTGSPGYVNGSGSQAMFDGPTSVAVDASGNVFVADFNNNVVRKITPGGTVSTYAGQAGLTGSGDGPAGYALFNAPNGVSVDAAGNVYVTDSLVPALGSTVAGNNLLRMITPSGAVITLAGQAGVTGSNNGTGTAAQFYSLQASKVTSAGEFYLADTYNQTIRAAGNAPAVVTQPLGQVITIGQQVTFTATLSGTTPFTYQWLKNSSAISGATGSSYSIASVAPGDAGNYSVMVTNPFGTITSSAVTLIPVNAQPVAQSVNPGSAVTFSVSVAAAGPLAYQWLFNGAAIGGATGSSYNISSASVGTAGNYSIVVSDANGVATTNPVSLTLNPALATDTPTLPSSALLILACLLFFVAIRQLQSVK